jgi:ankyrin repeat protein
MRTALVLAAIQDDVETCKLLIEKGKADVNIRDKVQNIMDTC